MAASKKRLQSQHSSFDDSLTIHPLRSLLKSIQDEVDQEYTHKLIYLSRRQLQDKYPASIKVDDLLDLFNALEERYGTDHAADFMETLLEYEQLHGEFGAWKLADGMRQYKEEKVEYISKCQKLGFCQDPYFVGREKVMRDIIQDLQGSSSVCKGVMICGSQGVGKSSLAREVCYKLSNNSDAWQITFVDLRVKETFTELLQSLLLQVSDQRFLKKQDQELMKAELLHCLKKKAQSEYYKSIIWMDNIDGLCDTTDKISIFRDFIKEICCSMCLEGESQMKLLLTVDKNACSENLSMDQHVIPDLRLVELDYLSPSESELLMKKYTRSLEMVSDNTSATFSHGLSGGNPLVVRMLGNLLRGGRSMNDIERCLQDQNELLLMDSLLNEVINVTFRALVTSLQVLLVKLSIFKLTPFSLADAILIISKDVKTFEKLILVRRSSELTELSHGLLVELSWLKLYNFIEPKDGQISKNIITMRNNDTFRYHFHPFIEKQLQIYQSLDEFKDVYNEAKYYFCRYICSVINKYIRKLDTDMQEASTLWEEHNNHFNTWFHYIISDCLPIDSFYDLQAQTGHQSLLCQYRIWRVAQTVLDFSEQLNFLQQQIKFANQSSKWYPAVVWVSFIAEYYAGQNQIEEAHHMIMTMSTEYNVLKFINGFEVAGNLSNILAIFKRIDDKYSIDESRQILVSCAFYCGACCKILMKMENYSKTTKHYIILAEKLFSGKYGKSDIRNHIKQSYKYELANVREMKKIYNAMHAKPNDCSAYNFYLNQHVHQHGCDSHAGVSVDSNNSHAGVSVGSNDSHAGVSVDSKDIHFCVSLDSNDSHAGVSMDSNDSHASVSVDSDNSHAGVSVDSNKKINVETDRISKCTACDNQMIRSTHNIECQSHAGVSVDSDKSIDVETDRISKYRPCDTQTGNIKDIVCMNNTELNATLSTTCVKESVVPTANEAAKTDLRLRNANNTKLSVTLSTTGVKESDIPTTHVAAITDVQLIRRCSNDLTDFPAVDGNQREADSETKYSDILTTSEGNLFIESIKRCSSSDEAISSRYIPQELIKSSGQRRLSGLSNTLSVSELSDILDRDSYLSTDSQNSVDTDKSRNESFSSSIDRQDRLSRKRPSIDSQYSSFSSEVGRKVSLNRLESQDSVTQLMGSLNTASSCQNSVDTDETTNDSFSSSINLQDRLSRKRPSIDSQYSSFSSDDGRRVSLNRLESQDSVTQLMGSLNTESIEEDGPCIGSNDELWQQQSEMSVSDDGPILFKMPKQHE